MRVIRYKIFLEKQTKQIKCILWFYFGVKLMQFMKGVGIDLATPSVSDIIVLNNLILFFFYHTFNS